MLGRGPYTNVDCRPTHALVQKLKATLDELREAARTGEWTIEWQRLDEVYRQAMAADQRSDFTEAVRQFCRAISHMMNELRLQNVRKQGATTLELNVRAEDQV